VGDEDINTILECGLRPEPHRVQSLALQPTRFRAVTHPTGCLAGWGADKRSKAVQVEMKIFDRFFNPPKKAEKKTELGRNELCWCGSGKKYKRCHLDKDAHKKRMQMDSGAHR